jgi:hypothetical protein
VSEHRYEFRVTGRLPQTGQDAFTGMELVEMPAETVISGEVDDRDVPGVLALIQELGLRLVSVRRAGTPEPGR